jgi:hypothetical protein
MFSFLHGWGFRRPLRIRLTSWPPVAIPLKQIVQPAKVAALVFFQRDEPTLFHQCAAQSTGLNSNSAP